MIDNSDLGPEVLARAPETVPVGHVRMRVVSPAQHWESWAAHGDRIIPHLRAPDGSVVVDAPREATAGLAKAGYAIVNQ
jgi:hypothetical protein